MEQIAVPSFYYVSPCSNGTVVSFDLYDHKNRRVDIPSDTNLPICSLHIPNSLFRRNTPRTESFEFPDPIIDSMGGITLQLDRAPETVIKAKVNHYARFFGTVMAASLGLEVDLEMVEWRSIDAGYCLDNKLPAVDHAGRLQVNVTELFIKTFLDTSSYLPQYTRITRWPIPVGNTSSSSSTVEKKTQNLCVPTFTLDHFHLDVIPGVRANHPPWRVYYAMQPQVPMVIERELLKLSIFVFLRTKEPVNIPKTPTA